MKALIELIETAWENKELLKEEKTQHAIREVVDLLKRLALEQSCSVLMVTHDPRILDVADRLIKMEDGKLLPSLS